MSRKSRRNTLKNAAKAERVSALRLPYGTLGLSSLALGSMAIAGAAHAQSATANGTSTDTTKPKATPTTQQAKSLRAKLTRVASSKTLPAGGAGLVAQSANTAALSNAASATGDATGPQTSSAGSAQQLQEIVVTGIRGSLQRALQIKEMSTGVVDAISAEDIGQFPDASVGAAIGRIPGVTVNRGSINQMSSAGAPTATGNVTGITVRGFGVQFNELLAEGRPLASGNGQNIDYSALGANYVGEVDVLKTPDYSLSSGAIGATINIKYPKPFDNPGPHVQAFYAENDYENDGGLTPSFGALLSDTFADGKFGILIDGDYTDKHILGHHMDIVGWEAVHIGCSQYAAGAVPASCAGQTTNPNYSWYPQDMAMYYERTDSRTKDGRVALQWRPFDTMLVTVDDNYSSDNETTDRWQFSAWFSNTGLQNVVQDGNGTITSFNQGEAPTDFNAFIATDYIVTNTPGINVTWDPSDDWTAEFDADQSVSKLNPNGGYTDVDSDDGYGPNTAVGTNGYVGGAVVAGSNSVPYWSAIGPGANAVTGPTTTSNFLGLDPYIVGSHVQVLQSQQNTDKITQVKLDATWHSGSTKVNFGAQFVDENWNSVEMDTLTNNYWQLWSGYGPASNNYEYYCQQPVTNSSNAYGNTYVNSAGTTVNTCGAAYSQTALPAGGPAITVLHGVSLPSSMFTAINFKNFIPGFSNNGHLPPGLLLYSPWSVLNYLEKQPINKDWTPNAGYPQYSGGVPAMAVNAGLYQHFDRPTYSPFITAEHNFDFSDGMELRADVGLRYERTTVQVAGLNATIQSLGVEPGDKTAYAFNLNPAELTVANNSYNYFLPSLDLNLMVTPHIKVRLDLSRTETEPQTQLITPSVQYGGRVGELDETLANPDLLPYLSDNYDLGAEWYYASNDYVSVDGYFKHVTQFPVSSSTAGQTIPGIIATSSIDPNVGGLAQWQVIKNVNGNAANVTGIEATWQQMLWYGFGFQINGTYVHTNRNFNPSDTAGPQFALPGIGNSANVVAFYQRHGLQLRLAYQWQGSQLLQLGQEQPQGAFGTNEPEYLDSSTELDASGSYDFTKYLSAYFEAFNLTDQVYHMRGRWDNQVLNLVDYGRSFSMGVRLKF